MFLDLIEYQLCNGWELIAPELCGALTGVLTITDACERDEEIGKIVRLGRIYSNIDYYQVESDIARLLRLGCVVWGGIE